MTERATARGRRLSAAGQPFAARKLPTEPLNVVVLSRSAWASAAGADTIGVVGLSTTEVGVWVIWRIVMATCTPAATATGLTALAHFVCERLLTALFSRVRYVESGERADGPLDRRLTPARQRVQRGELSALADALGVLVRDLRRVNVFTDQQLCHSTAVHVVSDVDSLVAVLLSSDMPMTDQFGTVRERARNGASGLRFGGGTVAVEGDGTRLLALAWSSPAILGRFVVFASCEVLGTAGDTRQPTVMATFCPMSPFAGGARRSSGAVASSALAIPAEMRTFVSTCLGHFAGAATVRLDVLGLEALLALTEQPPHSVLSLLGQVVRLGGVRPREMRQRTEGNTSGNGAAFGAPGEHGDTEPDLASEKAWLIVGVESTEGLAGAPSSIVYRCVSSSADGERKHHASAITLLDADRVQPVGGVPPKPACSALPLSGQGGQAQSSSVADCLFGASADPSDSDAGVVDDDGVQRERMLDYLHRALQGHLVTLVESSCSRRSER